MKVTQKEYVNAFFTFLPIEHLSTTRLYVERKFYDVALARCLVLYSCGDDGDEKTPLAARTSDDYIRMLCENNRDRVLIGRKKRRYNDRPRSRSAFLFWIAEAEGWKRCKNVVIAPEYFFIGNGLSFQRYNLPAECAMAEAANSGFTWEYPTDPKPLLMRLPPIQKPIVTYKSRYYAKSGGSCYESAADSSKSADGYWMRVGSIPSRAHTVLPVKCPICESQLLRNQNACNVCGQRRVIVSEAPLCCVTWDGSRFIVVTESSTMHIGSQLYREDVVLSSKHVKATVAGQIIETLGDLKEHLE